MNYADLNPETRKAYMETCEKILAQDCSSMEPRAYFERTLKELKTMETKMTKEEAKKEIKKISSTIEWHNRDVNHLTKKLAELQAIIDAPEVDPRVGKLFVFQRLENGKDIYFIVRDVSVDKTNFFTLNQGAYVVDFCRPVTREEALAMVYEPEAEKSCKNCGDACYYYCINYSRWIPKP